jgi:CRISPR-associated endonuclease/helicase Cas3
VGNIDPDADEYINAKAMKGKIDHSSAGAQLIWQTLSNKGQIESIVAQVLALCIASHHSGLIDNLTSNKKSLGENSFSKRLAKNDDKTHLQEAMEKMDLSIRQRYKSLIKDPKLISHFQEVITSILKKQSQYPVLAQFHSGLVVRFLFSCLIDADRQDSADFESPDSAKQRQNSSYKDFSLLLKRLENRLSGFTIDSDVNNIRHQISNECLQAAEREQGIFTLSVPTGGGKTLASLRFALRHAEKHKLDRIIYIVPFTSIIDQNAQDARKTLDDSKGDIVLEHHSNLASDKQTYRNKILSENWDAPIIYTTSVQFLETLF